LKTCTKCSVEKALDEFHRARLGKYGRVATCKACMAQYARANSKRFNERALASYYRLSGPNRAEKAAMRAQFLASPKKHCSQCSTTKPKDEFGRSSQRADGLRPICKICHAANNRAWREANPETAADCGRRSREKRGITFRLHRTVSGRVRQMLRGGKQTLRTFDVLGYNVEELKRHLERQFTGNIGWGNYGDYWHVDHIVPLKDFVIEKMGDREMRAAWALSNLRPLPAAENLRKHASRLFLV